MLRRKSGFTLIELVVVLILFVMVAALTFAAITDWTESDKIEQESEKYKIEIVELPYRTGNWELMTVTVDMVEYKILRVYGQSDGMVVLSEKRLDR